MTSEREPLAVEDVARFPLPGASVPGAFAFSPDDRFVTWLHDPQGGLKRKLMVHDVASGETRVLVGGEEAPASEAELSLEERLRRERRREVAVGVTRYAWADEGRRLLVPLGGAVCVIDVPGGALRTVVEADPPPLDPRLSPDGSVIAYVADGDVWVADAGTDSDPGAHAGDASAGAADAEGNRGPARRRRVTSGAAGPGITRGLAEFVAQEEMGRHEGYWWSPDSSSLAFCEVDESAIPLYRIVHQGAEVPVEEAHPYPFAGGPNASVRLGVVPAGGGNKVWARLTIDGDGDGNGNGNGSGSRDGDGVRYGYLARAGWFPDGSLWAQLQDRAQSRLDLVRIDPTSGAARLLLREESDTWVNLHDLFRPLDAGGFLWGSEASGFRHLSLHDDSGRLIRTLTAGDWLVERLVAVDEQRGVAWVVGTLDGPTERHLYAVPLAGGEPRRLTAEPGVHAVVVDHRAQLFVDTHSSTDRPPAVTLRRLDDGSPVRRLHDDVDPRVAQLDLRPPELATFAARDGVILHAALYHPEGVPPFPTVVSVYGGPGVQRVRNGWEVTVAMRAQLLARLGFLVVAVDNRGSAGRGVAFEAAVRHDLGKLEVRDQVDGVQWLVGRGVADPTRVGIYGWSYGGYLAAMAVARAPETFSVGVAGAPVTSWDGYDTHYTERYMGTPETNPEGYRRSSVLPHAEGVRGRLLIVHGLLDENVHFRHTARLVNALVRARVDHELAMLPDERHLPRDQAGREWVEERVRDFFVRHLRPAVAAR